MATIQNAATNPSIFVMINAYFVCATRQLRIKPHKTNLQVFSVTSISNFWTAAVPESQRRVKLRAIGNHGAIMLQAEQHSSKMQSAG